MIVRNPLDRILSAYRDKLERCSQCNYLHISWISYCRYNKYYYDKYGRAIVQRYRSRGVAR